MHGFAAVHFLSRFDRFVVGDEMTMASGDVEVVLTPATGLHVALGGGAAIQRVLVWLYLRAGCWAEATAVAMSLPLTGACVCTCIRRCGMATGVVKSAVAASGG